MKTRINLGTFDKETAELIRNELKRVKTFRKDKVETCFKSRTYGNRKNNPHDGTVKINDAKKVAVYLNIENKILEEYRIDYATRQKMIDKAIKNCLENPKFIEAQLLNGFKGFEYMNAKELLGYLL